MKLHKALAVIGAGLLLFAATDAVTYAATGSSLVLGKINQANAITTIQNTGTGNALRLLTKSTATAPLVVNGKGKVTNLYADRAAKADNASKLGGQTIAQVRTGINAATVGGQTVAQVRTGIDAATLDGQTAAQVVSSVPRPAGVVWVAQSGGQFTSVSAALASITDNGPAHRYAIKVAPGTYTEVASVVLKSYVDIEGSGQDVTTITCSCGSSTFPRTDGSSAVLQVTGPGMHVGIRGLTITNIGSSLSYSTGILTTTTDPGDVSLDALTISATGGTTNYGLYNNQSSPTMTNVTATAADGTNSVGIYNYSSPSPTMTNVTATATGGTSGNYGIVNSSSSTTMTNVTATATGGTIGNYGIFNGSSSTTMTGGRATASGGSGLNTGIWNSGGVPTYDTVTATGTGGTQARGIVNLSSASVTLVNVTATGSGGTANQNWGIDNSSSSSMTIRDSFITGTPNSILNTGSATDVAYTRLSSPASGTMTCIGTYDATTFAALTATCQ